jgi:hypothetical protein
MMPAYIRRAGDGVGEFLVALFGVTLVVVLVLAVLFLFVVYLHLLLGTPLPGLLPQNNGPYRVFTGALEGGAPYFLKLEKQLRVYSYRKKARHVTVALRNE